MKYVSCVLISKGDSLILGFRAGKYSQGKLAVPGGRIEAGETKEAAALREVEEEVGVGIKNLEFFTSVKANFGGADDWTTYFFTADWAGGEISAASDLLDARFYSRQEIAVANADGTLSRIDAEVLIRAGWL